MICSIQNLAKLLKFRLGAKSLRLALSYLNKEEVEKFSSSVEQDTSIKESTLSQLKLIVNTIQFKYYPKVKMSVNFSTSELQNNEVELADFKEEKENKLSMENNINNNNTFKANEKNKETKDVLFLKNNKQEEIINAEKILEVRENNTNHSCSISYSDVIRFEVLNDES